MFKTHISTTIPLSLATRLQAAQEAEGWKNVSALMRTLVENYVEEFESGESAETSETEDVSNFFDKEAKD